MTSIPTSGVGSWPGTDIDEAVRQVFDLAAIPYLPELPARGPGSDMVGRALGLMDGLAFELSPHGWRAASRPSEHQRRARARLRDDLDVLAERAEGYAGPLKVAMCGWWTLCAVVELGRGGPILRDAGAVRDLIQSGRAAAEGLLADVRSLVPGANRPTTPPGSGSSRVPGGRFAALSWARPLSRTPIPRSRARSRSSSAT